MALPVVYQCEAHTDQRNDRAEPLSADAGMHLSDILYTLKIAAMLNAEVRYDPADFSYNVITHGPVAGFEFKF